MRNGLLVVLGLSLLLGLATVARAEPMASSPTACATETCDAPLAAIKKDEPVAGRSPSDLLPLAGLVCLLLAGILLENRQPEEASRGPGFRRRP